MGGGYYAGRAHAVLAIFLVACVVLFTINYKKSRKKNTSVATSIRVSIKKTFVEWFK